MSAWLPHAAALAVTLLAAHGAASAPAAAASTGEHRWKREFWERQRKGANCQNRVVTAEYWRAARAAGIQFVRLAPHEWRTGRRDFLIGDADSFRTVDRTDLATLRAALAEARAAGVPVVLSMFSLPGARNRQMNGDRDDLRLWTKPGYREQALEFWRQLATELRGDSAIVAYNPLNEPHPERAFGITSARDPRFAAWRRDAAGTRADLNAFNREMVAAIRSVDPETPIILDGWDYSSPEGLVHLEPVDDPDVLYALHNFGPWDYTTFRVNRGRFRYPDRMPEGWTPRTNQDRAEAIAQWARTHGVPESRIVAEEVLVDRRVEGAQRYLADVTSLLDRRRWHWAFYAFRSDSDWGGLDYELGTRPLGQAYWDAVGRGEDAERLKRRGPNPLWDVIARALAAP